MKDDHADQTGEHSADAPHQEFLVAAGGHHQHGEQRRRRIQDRGQSARDIGLPHHDQRERQHVVEQRDAEERPPARKPPRKGDPIDPQDRQQNQRRERHAKKDQRERRQFFQRNAVEKERSAPENRQHPEQRPVPAVNSMIAGFHGRSIVRDLLTPNRKRRFSPPDFRAAISSATRSRSFLLRRRPAHGLSRVHRPRPPRVPSGALRTTGSRPAPPRKRHPCGAAPP